jgi:hypothetical protein
LQITQKDLAKRVNVDPKTLRNWKENRPELLEILYLGIEAEQSKSEDTVAKSVIINANKPVVNMGGNVKNITSTNTTDTKPELDISDESDTIKEIVDILKKLPPKKQRKIRLQAELELLEEE